MATYTPNIGLHQWEPEDNFLRTDFNEDLEKIDDALGNTVQLIIGTYIGDGTDSREIVLGVCPKAVLVYCGALAAAKMADLSWRGSFESRMGATLTSGYTTTGQGFLVSVLDGISSSMGNTNTNHADQRYFYFAWV